MSLKYELSSERLKSVHTSSETLSPHAGAGRQQEAVPGVGRNHPDVIHHEHDLRAPGPRGAFSPKRGSQSSDSPERAKLRTRANARVQSRGQKRSLARTKGSPIHQLGPTRNPIRPGFPRCFGEKCVKFQQKPRSFCYLCDFAIIVSLHLRCYLTALLTLVGCRLPRPRRSRGAGWSTTSRTKWGCKPRTRNPNPYT